MSIKATTEPMFFPGSGTWKNIPINTGFGTPGIIDHYPEGPGETRPFEPPLNGFPSGGYDMVLRYPQTRLPGQTGFEIGDGFALGTNPFDGGSMGNLAGRYGLWGGLGQLIGAGLGKFFGKK
jgi:hypothetical protein